METIVTRQPKKDVRSYAVCIIKQKLHDNASYRHAKFTKLGLGFGFGDGLSVSMARDGAGLRRLNVESCVGAGLIGIEAQDPDARRSFRRLLD